MTVIGRMLPETYVCSISTTFLSKKAAADAQLHRRRPSWLIRIHP